MATRGYHASTTTYNLTTTHLHTYYVLAGPTPLLVHNCGGTGTIRWDPDLGHATVRVETASGESLETEQVINGIGQNGNYDGLATTAAEASGSGPNTIEHSVYLPNADAALQAQRASIGADLGGYDQLINNCVTYCIDVLRAGGAEIPAGVRGTARPRRLLR